MPAAKTEGGHAALTALIASREPNDGASMPLEESNASYVIIRHNVRTYRSSGVVEVIKSRDEAEALLKKFEEWQTSADRQDGWRYFFEKSDLKPGMDPTEATHRRQSELAIRESKHSE